MNAPACTLAFDVGKTHVKTTVLDADGHALDRRRAGNIVRQDGPYPHMDVDAIWDWLGEQVEELGETYPIVAISIATHGATAALVDLETEELILPVMDYECDDYPDLPDDYDGLRDGFAQTGSPRLPAGLNLGRQLQWQAELMGVDDKYRATLLFYPQYWAWRLTGRAVTEMTSMGCHTDLWNVRENRPTDLLARFGLDHNLPPTIKAWQPLGALRPDLAKRWNLSPECQVWPGLHDSNAGYAPYLRLPMQERPTVLSTGTWAVMMDGQADLDRLDPERDMLINLDAAAEPLATARYMGGREFERVCETLDADMNSTFALKDVSQIVAEEALILPCFAPGTGPYPNGYGRVTETLINGKAAATLYSALMLADMADRLTPGATRDLLIEGSFAQNRTLCGLLATLLPHRSVRRHEVGSGVVDGCFALTHWETAKPTERGERVAPLSVPGLSAYAESWAERVRNRRGFQP